MVGHVAAEAVRGGPIAAVRDGDTVTIDTVTIDAATIDAATIDAATGRREGGGVRRARVGAPVLATPSGGMSGVVVRDGVTRSGGRARG